ncbi:MAG: hypothetical protein ACO1NX_04830 [Chitinophagaceae bacterium]
MSKVFNFIICWVYELWFLSKGLENKTLELDSHNGKTVLQLLFFQKMLDGRFAQEDFWKGVKQQANVVTPVAEKINKGYRKNKK